MPRSESPLPPLHSLLKPVLAAPPEAKPSRALERLAHLMRQIAACRAEGLRRQALVEEMEKRLHADQGPLEQRMTEVRVETHRILTRHLREGWLKARDRKVLEKAVLNLGEDIEAGGWPESRKPSEEEEDSAAGQETDEEGWDGPAAEKSASSDHMNREGDASGPSKGFAASAAAPGDIRALYLMLARALHPDKEPDPSRLAVKTAWMQKVTAAYGARDLAALLDILLQNPLDAVGPYLTQAPAKTVQGFVKRLKRDLASLRASLEADSGQWHPFFAEFIKSGQVDEAAYKRHLAEVKKAVKFMKLRTDLYRSREGVQELVESLRRHDWRELM